MSKLVVHCKRAAYDVYIGRPGKWGNPIALGNPRDAVERALVLKLYRMWLKLDSALVEKYGRPPSEEEIRQELKGQILGCWCSPRPCHGDILAEIANS